MADLMGGTAMLLSAIFFGVVVFATVRSSSGDGRNLWPVLAGLALLVVPLALLTAELDSHDDGNFSKAWAAVAGFAAAGCGLGWWRKTRFTGPHVAAGFVALVIASNAAVRIFDVQ